MFDLSGIQKSLNEFGLDGWLLLRLSGANILARRVLGLDQKPAGSRRFFYFVPARGEPRKLVHRIETAALDLLPGENGDLSALAGSRSGRRRACLRGSHRVAMEYAPRVSNPYVSRVDAGTIELVRGCGVEIVSSGDLIQQFEATWDDEQWQMHQEAEKVTTCRVRRGLRADRRASRGRRHDPRDRSSGGDHGPFPSPRADDVQPADRRSRPAQRRPALRAGRRQGRRDRCEMTWS